MNESRRYGRTETPVHHLDEFVWDLGMTRENQVYGQTETPVIKLPEFNIDFSDFKPVNSAFIETLRRRLQERDQSISVSDPRWSAIVLQEIELIRRDQSAPPLIAS